MTNTNFCIEADGKHAYYNFEGSDEILYDTRWTLQQIEVHNEITILQLLSNTDMTTICKVSINYVISHLQANEIRNILMKSQYFMINPMKYTSFDRNVPKYEYPLSFSGHNY